MRNLFFIAAFFALCVACKNQENTEVKTVEIKTADKKEHKATMAHYTKAEFTIEGMTCAIGCAATIEKKLAALQGVKTAKVDFEHQLATVEYDKTKLTPQDIAFNVTSVGDGETYTVVNMKEVDKTSEAHCNKGASAHCCAAKNEKKPTL